MHQLIVLEPKVEGTEKKVGENVFLDDLQYDYKVYLFYYPGAMPNEDLECKLTRLGEISGKNLFVNIGELDDPKFDLIREKFNIKTLPVIVITGIDGVASLKGDNDLSTAYTRIDNKDRLICVDSTVDCVQMLFNLFIGGEIIDALKTAKNYNVDTRISLIRSKIKTGLNAIGKFVWEKDIEVSLIGLKFAIKSKQ